MLKLLYNEALSSHYSTSLISLNDRRCVANLWHVFLLAGMRSSVPGRAGREINASKQQPTVEHNYV